MFIPSSIYSIPQKDKKYLTSKNSILKFKDSVTLTSSLKYYLFEDIHSKEEKRVDLIFHNGKSFFSVETDFSKANPVEEYLISEY